MSYINFLLRGIEGQQAEYRRDHFPRDSHDNADRIATISDKVRNACQDVWNKLKSSTKITFIVTIIGGLAGIASAIGLGILLPPLLPVALIVGIISLGIFGFSFFARHRSNQATDQLKLWTDPTSNYADPISDYIEQYHKQQILEMQQQMSEIQWQNESRATVAKRLQSEIKKYLNEIKELETREAEKKSKPKNEQDPSKLNLLNEGIEFVNSVEDRIKAKTLEIENEKDPSKLNQLNSKLEFFISIKDTQSEMNKTMEMTNKLMEKVEDDKPTISTIISSLEIAIKLNTIQYPDLKEHARDMLKPYFNKYPALKSIF